MPRYIDANGLLRVSDAYDISTLKDWYINSVDDNPPVWTISHLEELLRDFYVVPKENEPITEAEEVRHGDWEDDADDVYWGNYIVKKHCSECGYTPKFDRETELFDLTKRCPNCGAKMDGKESGE